MKVNLYRSCLKRAFDLILSSLLIVLLAPLFILLMPVLFMVIGQPVFFIQERPGKDGRLFKVIKLRTMVQAFDRNGKALPDYQRLTSAGRMLRSLSIDELPQLLNVVKGEMSIVGPRPLLKEYLTLYNTRQARRHEVRPGITGLAQVNGRNGLNWQQKLEYDTWYVENLSFLLDIKIILRTIFKVAGREGINSAKAETMEPFKGN